MTDVYPHSRTPAQDTLSINGDFGTVEIPQNVTVPFIFTYHDDNGASEIWYAQFDLLDSAGNYHCGGDWGQPNGLDLYDGNTGVTYGFGQNQTDASCTVFLVSVAPSSTDSSALIVGLNFNFKPGFSGTYSVVTQVNYVDGTPPIWETLGTVIIDPAPGVTITDSTQTSGSYFAGDSFTLTVSGLANQAVSVVLDGFRYGQVGTTNASGQWTTSASWGSSNAGYHTETWSVGDAASTIAFYVNQPFTVGGVTNPAEPVLTVNGSTVTVTIAVTVANGLALSLLTGSCDGGNSVSSVYYLSGNILFSVSPGTVSGIYGCQASVTYAALTVYLSFQIAVAPTVVISRGGVPISGNSPSNPVPVSVGDPIVLTTVAAGLPSGVTISSQSWSVTGTRVMGYTNLNAVQALTNATVTNFADPGTSGITFYWIDSDNVTNYSVTYTARLSNQTSVSAVALFHVARPTPVSFSGTTSTMTPVVNAGNIQEFGPTTPSLNFGYNPAVNNGSPGITYNMSVSTGYGGSAALLQLVNVADSYVLTSGVTQRENSNGYVLDAPSDATVPMYSGIVTALQPGTTEWMLNDQPAIGLSAGLTSVTANQQFMTYLIYKPPTSGAIWVTLAVMNWNWFGTTTLNANGSWGQPTAAGFTPNPAGANSNVQPQWTNNVFSVPLQ